MLQLETNELFDLVIHACSFLPSEDNASLYSLDYINWAQALLQKHPLRPTTVSLPVGLLYPTGLIWRTKHPIRH